MACGDSLVKLYIGQISSGDVKQDIATALNALFSSGQYNGALYNATYSSSFRVENVDYKVSSKYADITLSGSYVKPADYCDARRYREQVWATARQFEDVSSVTIRLDNGLLLGDLLSAFWDK